LSDISLSDAVHYLIQSDIEYPMSESHIMAHYSSDTLPTCIEYHSADRYDTYTMYNPADVCWDVLNDIMSSYYLRYYQIFRLNGVAEAVYQVCVLHESVSVNVKTCHALPVMPVLLEIEA